MGNFQDVLGLLKIRSSPHTKGVRSAVGNILAAALQRPILRSTSKAQLSGHQYSHSQSSPMKPAQTRRFPALSEPRTRRPTTGDAPDPLPYLLKPVRPLSCPFRPTPLVRRSS